MDSNHRYPAKFFWPPLAIPAQFTFRNINRLPRDRDQWFESISLQRGVHCEPDFLGARIAPLSLTALSAWLALVTQDGAEAAMYDRAVGVQLEGPSVNI